MSAKTSLLSVILLSALTDSAWAQIVTFSFTGAAGNESSFAPDSQPVGATVGSMTRGSGLTADTTAGTFNSSSWTTGLSADANDYYTFSITPHSGISMSLTRLELDERRSASGIRNWSVRSSLDSFGSDLALFSVPDDISTRTDQAVALNSAFGSLTSSLEFRIYGFAAESGSGTWRIDNVQLSGTLTAVPEPHEYALAASLGLLGFAGYRRWMLRHGTARV